jgi:hypothetical protein
LLQQHQKQLAPSRDNNNDMLQLQKRQEEKEAIGEDASSCHLKPSRHFSRSFFLFLCFFFFFFFIGSPFFLLAILFSSVYYLVFKIKLNFFFGSPFQVERFRTGRNNAKSIWSQIFPVAPQFYVVEHI